MWWVRPAGAAALLSGCLWISDEHHARRTDRDGDGSPTPEDCDDTDPSRYPEAPELACDGVDNDCNANSADGPAAVRTTVSETEEKTVTYESIARAMEGAHPGETLVICAGHFTEQLILTIPNLTVTGTPTGEGTIFDTDGLNVPGIEVYAADVTIENLSVINGVGKTIDEYGTWGGGIYAFEAGGNLTLNQVDVAGNLAAVGAGVAGPAAGELVITASNLHDNHGTVIGGALYVSDTATLIDTLISANIADAIGGGIGIGPGAAVTASGTTEISGNASVAGGGVAILIGGSLTGGLITGNGAAEDGGGVTSAGGDLTDVDLVDNFAYDEGGGLEIYGGIVTRGLFRGNTAPNGGGVFVTGNVDMYGSVFEDNVAEGGDGGGILVVAGLLTLATDGAGTASFATSFSGNVAENRGGGIAAIGGSLSVLGGEIAGGAANYGGGIAIVDDDECPDCTYDLNTLGLTSNEGARDGGGIWTTRSVTISNVDFDENSTEGVGGGLYAAGEAVVVMEGGTISGNTALSGAGAAFYVNGADAPSTIGSTTFSANTADDSGAAVLVASGFVEAIGSLFTNNSSEADGAAVNVDNLGNYHSEGVTYSLNESFDIELPTEKCNVVGDDAVFDCSGGTDSCTPAASCQ